MPRDPFYKQILDGLAEPLDPRLFQECAVDLLRGDWPTIVPLVGSADGGMDGAIADGVGLPFPLVCTTVESVIGNLTNSLKSYRKRSHRRDRVILATSQELTPKRRLNLENRAKELGFDLVQQYTRRAIADRLYQNPRWCRDLLGLTGDPPALSAIPRGARPLLGDVLVGRDADLKWLRQAGCDLVLSGQPGSGKTFLLHTYAREANGLFLVSGDRGRIASGIREQQPDCIIVDDAHDRIELLRSLMHLRTEIQGKFAILATSWPYEAAVVRENLGIPSMKSRELERLTRDEIVEVVKLCGVSAPNRLVREIVNQAEGRPGLAVTLTQLCLQGDISEVVGGDVLVRSVSAFFRKKLDAGWQNYLAGFAIGGNSGMALQDVASLLEKPVTDVKNAIDQLAAAGFIRENEYGRLSVQPDTLRFTVIRDVFFCGANSLPFMPFVRRSTSLSDVVQTLAGARGHGADVPLGPLTLLAEEANSTASWLAYVWLGREETEYVLTRHPDLALGLARPVLCHAPDLAIPCLLTKAVGDQRRLPQTPDHPIRLIEAWVKDGRLQASDPVSRRSALLEATKQWLNSNQDADVGMKALAAALSVAVDYSETDPGSGMTFTLSVGVLSPEELGRVFAFWPTARELIAGSDPAHWVPIRECIESWAYPSGQAMGGIPKATHDRVVDLAREMVKNVTVLAPDHQGVLYWARHLAKNLEARVNLVLDSDFDVLFPEEEHYEDRRARQQQIDNVCNLAEKWSSRDPRDVCRQLTLFIEQLKFPAHVWPNYLDFLCDELAGCVTSPVLWASEFARSGLPYPLVSPFLLRSAAMRHPGYEDVIRSCLGNEDLRLATAIVVLKQSAVPSDLLTKALSCLHGGGEHIEFECLAGFIEEEHLAYLLRHEDPAIAGAAAVGEWQADPKGSVRDTLLKDWRAAVARYTGKWYWLCEILRGDPDLAEEWLGERLRPESDTPYLREEIIDAAVGALDNEARRRVLKSLPRTYLAGEVIKEIVGGSLELFELLLQIPCLEQFHLYPLEGFGSNNWVCMAKKALGKGHSHHDIAMAAFTKIQTWMGKASDHETQWVQRFQKLCAHDDEDVRRIGAEGLARASASYEQALHREHEEAVYGRD